MRDRTRPGPPTKRTPEVERLIIEGLRAGLSERAAAGRVKVDEAQVRRWRLRFARFAADCDAAEAEAEARFTATIAQAAAPHDVVKTITTQTADGETVRQEVTREFDWRAAESWLKRRRRVDWGDNINVDLDAEVARYLALLVDKGSESVPGSDT